MIRGILWLCAGFVFLGIDLLLPHMVLLFFGFGAFAAALTEFLGFGLAAELCTFSLVSVVTLLLFRKKCTAIFGSSTTAHPLLGRSGCVSRAIAPGQEGEIQIDGSFWRARADCELSVGTSVIVCDIAKADSLCVIVRATTHGQA